MIAQGEVRSGSFSDFGRRDHDLRFPSDSDRTVAMPEKCQER
jgi:hypothetical protein